MKGSGRSRLRLRNQRENTRRMSKSKKGREEERESTIGLLTTFCWDPNQFGVSRCKLKWIDGSAPLSTRLGGVVEQKKQKRILCTTFNWFAEFIFTAGINRAQRLVPFFFIVTHAAPSARGERGEEELFFFFYWSTREPHVSKPDNKDSVIAASSRRNLLSMLGIEQGHGGAPRSFTTHLSPLSLDTPSI